MDVDLPSASIVAFFIILIIDIFVHGFQVAIDHVSKDEIEKKSASGKDKIGERLLKLFENEAVHIERMQILSIVMNMILGGFVACKISVYLASLFGARGGSLPSFLLCVLSGAVIALVIMCFGVIIPRRLSARNPEKWAYACYYPVYYLGLISAPFSFLAGIIATGILYIFGVRGDDKLDDVTEEEIRDSIEKGQEQGVIQEAEADMITNIFEFSDKEAQDIMTNRNAMMAIDANVSLKEAVNFMMDTNNSRFPVYLDDIDHIIGIMHIRDAMKKLSEETDEELPIRKIKGLLRQPKFVPETRNIDSLFHSMQSSKTQMVVVIDEYGQTAGLVTMEDILEEIVGNIMDEYDEDENYIKPTKNPMEFTVDGKTPLEVLEKRFDISFEESEFETLNGYLIFKLDRIPDPDEDFEVKVGGYNFKILSVQNHMVTSVLLQKLPEDTEEKEEDELEIANK